MTWRDKAVRCETCRFWGGDEDSYSGYQACHRYPPSNVVSNGLQVKFPMTGRRHWCGEHQPLPPPPEEG